MNMKKEGHKKVSKVKKKKREKKVMDFKSKKEFSIFVVS
jgi:hypothetical protein